MIKTRIFRVGGLSTNCCYLVDEATGKSAVSDPGDKSQLLIDQINTDGGKLEYILITHGHYDHIGFAKQLADMFGAKIVCGKKCAEFLMKPELNLSVYHNLELSPFKADILLEDGDTFMLGETQIRYISTPGHTSGCGGYIFDETYICGDTLFCESYGRTDLPTGNDLEMIKSFRKIRELEANYRVIPGHGNTSTLDHEKKYNPLMRKI